MFKQNSPANKGYVFFADTHYNGDMNITYKNVSAAIDKKLFNQLKWQAFQGTTSQFKKLPAKILNKNGTQIQKKFINMKGYIKFADTHYNGDMNKAYINVSATINKKLFLLLKWKHFQGTTSQFKKSPEKILNKDSTSVQTKFTGKQGYILFANTHYNGDMNLTHKNISAAIDKKLFNPLNWQAFKGTTSQFKKLPAKILGKDGTSVQTKFMGMKGYALFANTEYNGDMKKTYINVSAALDKKLFLLPGMEAISGTSLGTKRATHKYP